MNKSTKKVKSDRINVLRKQYDAFLEEDKRRKERNDLILNKLDGMRYCNATVPLRTNPTQYVNQPTGLYNNRMLLEKSSTYDKYQTIPTKQLPMEVSKKHFDDSIILQEITKKYILIPKRSSAFLNAFPESVKPLIESDSDWKSKYDILNQLKHHDKPEHEEENIHIKENNNLQNAESYTKPVSNYQPKIPISQQYPQHTNENPEKDVIDTKTENLENVENNYHYTDHANIKFNGKQCENGKLELTNDLAFNVKNSSVDQRTAEYVNFQNAIKENGQQIDFNISAPRNTLENSEIYSYNNPIGKEQLQNISPETHGENNIEGPIVSALESVAVSDQHTFNSIQDMKPENVIKESTNDNNIGLAEEAKQHEDIEYPIEIINAQELTPEENVGLQDSVNINRQNDQEGCSVPQESQNEAVVEPENHIDMSGIEEFDAEQREMFYSEQPNENYTYDQTNSENTYQEYPQSDNYQHGQEYTNYYEGVPPDQTYPTEINEFEETSQPYDQSYQEQYATYDPEYVQPETYEEQPQQYDAVQEIDPNMHPEVEQIQYEQQYESHNVEQELNNEQGYTENEELENTPPQLAGNMEHEQLKNITNDAVKNAEEQENITKENTLNN